MTRTDEESRKRGCDGNDEPHSQAGQCASLERWIGYAPRVCPVRFAPLDWDLRAEAGN